MFTNNGSGVIEREESGKARRALHSRAFSNWYNLFISGFLPKLAVAGENLRQQFKAIAAKFVYTTKSDSRKSIAGDVALFFF